MALRSRLFTIQQYYDERVRGIYTTVVESLAANPERRFIAVVRWAWRMPSEHALTCA
jgi:hypothetical protein